MSRQDSAAVAADVGALSGRDGSAVVRVAVRGPSWFRMYSVRQNGVLVSLSFTKTGAAAALNNQLFDRVNGVNSEH